MTTDTFFDQRAIQKYHSFTDIYLILQVLGFGDRDEMITNLSRSPS